MEDLLEFYGVLMTLALAAHQQPNKQATAMRNCAKQMLKNDDLSKNMRIFLRTMSQPVSFFNRFDPVGHYLAAVRRVVAITEDSPLSYVFIKDEEGERWIVPENSTQLEKQ